MGWNLVQTASWPTPNTSTSTPNATFSSPVGAGNLVVGVLDRFTSLITLTSVTDGKGDTATTYQALVDTTAGTTSHGFFFLNVTTSPTVITANLTGSANFCMLNVAEFSHTAGAITATDPNNTGNGQSQTTGGMVTSGNIQTLLNGDLIVGYCCDGSTTTVPTLGASFSTAGSSTGSTAAFAQLLEYLVQTTAGQIAATATVAVNDDTTTAVMAFAPPSGTPPPKDPSKAGWIENEF